MKTVHLVLFAMLSLLSACGGGGSDDTGSGTPGTAVLQEYRMWKCTIYRRTEGLTGLQYWSSCPNENWRLKADQPVFTSISDCEDAIRVLKGSDAVIYNNSEEDRARGWAVKLLCFEPDITPPAVLSVTPADGSSGFPIDGSRLRVDFSDNMDGATITTASFMLEDAEGTQIAGTVIYGYDQRVAVFDSNAPLEYLATYTARLTTDITDKVGNPLAGEYTWSFTTEDVPQPLANAPAPQLTFNLPQPEGRWVPIATPATFAARTGHSAVWTGNEMIIWGGKSPGVSVNTDSARYDPVADVWTPLPSQNAPGGNGPYQPASVVSTGTDVLVCLPKEELSYDQNTDEWYSAYVSETRRFNYQDQQWLSVVDGCNPQATPHAVWLNNRMLSWNSNYALGQTYNVQLDTWAPLPRYPDMFDGGATTLVAGDAVIVWGGRNVVDAGSRDTATNLGYRLVF